MRYVVISLLDVCFMLCYGVMLVGLACCCILVCVVVAVCYFVMPRFWVVYLLFAV